MSKLAWGAKGQKRYQTGVDRGVLFPTDDNGDYPLGVAWNGLTTVTESPSGAESNKQYADNGVYANLKSAEEFGFTIEAFYSPPEFDECDGSAEVAPGVLFGQQDRRSFGFSWRALLGNDVVGTRLGYKLHLVWGADAAPSEVANATVNDSPELGALSWECTTTAVEVGTLGGVEYKPVAHVTINSTRVDPTKLAALEDMIYGTVGDDPHLPTPAEVYTLFTTGVTNVDLGTYANQPSYNSGTHVVTLPAVTGVVWYVNGEETAAGALPALGVGETAEIQAVADSGYNLQGDDEWIFDY